MPSSPNVYNELCDGWNIRNNEIVLCHIFVALNPRNMSELYKGVLRHYVVSVSVESLRKTMLRYQAPELESIAPFQEFRKLANRVLNTPTVSPYVVDVPPSH